MYDLRLGQEHWEKDGVKKTGNKSVMGIYSKLKCFILVFLVQFIFIIECNPIQFTNNKHSDDSVHDIWLILIENEMKTAEEFPYCTRIKY